MENLSEDWEKHMPPKDVNEMTLARNNNGMGLGKKVVISGILIFSAPLILPPLFVISTFGLALSFPFGVLFTTYACTDKLMSKLLSTPTPPPLLHDDDDYDEIRSDAKEDMGFGETVDIGAKDENFGKVEEKIAPVIEVEEINEAGGNEKVIYIEGEKLDTETKDLKESEKDENTEKSNVEHSKNIGKPSGSKKKKSAHKMGGAIKKDSEALDGKAAKPVVEVKGLEQNANGKHIDKKIHKGRTDESSVNTKEGTEHPPSFMDVKSAPTAPVDHPASVSELPKSSSGKGPTRRSEK